MKTGLILINPSGEYLTQNKFWVPPEFHDKYIFDTEEIFDLKKYEKLALDRLPCQYIKAHYDDCGCLVLDSGIIKM